jgi:serine/threonine-protein kinase RsbW
MAQTQTFDVSSSPNGLIVEFSSTMENIDKIDALVKQLLTDRGLDKHAFAVRVVMREGLTNSVRHGHRHRPDKLIRFELALSPERLTMIIEDQGEGFDWRTVQQKNRRKSHSTGLMDHGRGFMIMDDYFDVLDYNEKGNRLILEKNISS